MKHWTAFALASLPGLTAAQGTVHVVDANEGPGFDFVQIADAVAAAGEGDTLLVRAGGYDAFTVDGKSLTITREKGFDVRVAGTVTVRNLGPMQRVVVHGLRNGTAIGTGLLVEDCAGVVWFEACEFIGESGSPAFDGVRVSSAAQAVFVRGLGEGGKGSGSLSGSAGAWGGDGMEAIHSNTYVWEMALEGRKGGDGDDIGGWGGNGFFFRSNGGHTAFIGGSRLFGADGGRADDDFDFICGCEQCGATGPGGDGVRVWGDPTTTVVLRDNAYTPGAGGLTTSPNPDCHDGTDGVELGTFDATVVQYTPGMPRFSTTSPTREGALIDMEAAGTPDDLVTLMISTQTLPVWIDPLVGIVGVLPPITFATFGVIDAGGTLAASLPAPGLPPGVESAVLHVQPIHLGLGGSVELSTPSALILLDDAF